jgi:hypothetical protein
MIQSGYIQPASKDKIHVLRSDFIPLQRIKDNFVDAVTNGLSYKFTQDIRPLVLTWPGALELSPPPSEMESISCVGVPAGDNKPVGTLGLSYYDAGFWSLPAGKQMLRKGSGPESYPLPASHTKVLDKAREFRRSFHAEPLQAPAWLYYSQMWTVPSAAGYKAPFISEYDQWTTTWGDGRVSEDSAKNRPDYYIFSYRAALESAHGDLPSDQNFLNDYFRGRLPEALAAIWAVDMMKFVISNPRWLDAFAQTRANGADISQVRTAIEPLGASGKESIFLKDALSTTNEFNSLICVRRGDCVSTYSAAKEKVAEEPLSALNHFSAALRAVSVDSPAYPFAEGNRGLALAKQLDWSSAAVSLQKAALSLQSRNLRNSSPSSTDLEFADVLQRNLGKSLVESGQCKAAEQYLRATANSWSYAKRALSKPCNDVESGFQYCFDTSDYCRHE